MNELSKDLFAQGRVEIQKPRRLATGQCKPWHLEKFHPDAMKNVGTHAAHICSFRSCTPMLARARDIRVTLCICDTIVALTSRCRSIRCVSLSLAHDFVQRRMNAEPTTDVRMVVGSAGGHRTDEADVPPDCGQ